MDSVCFFAMLKCLLSTPGRANWKVTAYLKNGTDGA